MGVLDSIRAKADVLDKTYNPLRKVGDAMEAAGENIGKLPDAQAAYEAKERAMNRNNPSYVPKPEPIPRAKGGCVKAGGHPMKTVGSKIKKESF